MSEAWLTIKRPGEERQYRDIAQSEVAGVVEQFEAIGEDVDRFKAFVCVAESQIIGLPS